MICRRLTYRQANSARWWIALLMPTTVLVKLMFVGANAQKESSGMQPLKTILACPLLVVATDTHGAILNRLWRWRAG